MEGPRLAWAQGLSFLGVGCRRRKSCGRRRSGRRLWTPGSGLNRNGWSRSGRSRKNASGATESGSSRSRSTGEVRPTAQGHAAPKPTLKGASCTSPSRRKQQSLEAEEAKRRLKEQSIFVSYFPGLLGLARKVRLVHVFCPLRARMGICIVRRSGPVPVLWGSSVCVENKQITETATTKTSFRCISPHWKRKSTFLSPSVTWPLSCLPLETWGTWGVLVMGSASEAEGLEN